MVRNYVFSEGLCPLKQLEDIIVGSADKRWGNVVVPDKSSHKDEINKILSDTQTYIAF